MSAQPEVLPVIELVSPMPGFPDNLQFVLVRLSEEGLLFSLTAVDNPDLRFLVMPPTVFFPDYAPEIPQDAVDSLGLTEPDDALLLLVVTAGEDLGDATANLMAPIVLHQPTRRAMQVVLTGSGLPVRAELVAPGA